MIAARAAAAHRRRGGRPRAAPDRPGRRAGVPDHAADADHPDVLEDGRRRRSRHGRIVNVESEHSAMSAAIGSALAGARTITATSSQGLALDGRSRLHRRLDARADRDGGRQPGAVRPDQHPLRPLRLDARSRLGRAAALRGERAGGVRPDGDGTAHRGASGCLAARARLSGRIHDHACGGAGRAAPGRGGARVHRRVRDRAVGAGRRPTRRRQGPFAMPDYYFELRRAQTRRWPRAARRHRRRSPTSSRASPGAASTPRGIPPRRSRSRDRRARIVRRDDQGRRRRSSRRRRACRPAQAPRIPAVSGRCRPRSCSARRAR